MGSSVEVFRAGPHRYREWREAVARLRIEVFRAFPYLYDGDLDYEAEYLETYARAPDSVWVIARAGGRVVGASTGVPLEHEGEEVQAPFRERGLDPGRGFYFGESVLLPEWRGQGIGHRFFDEREAHARGLGRFDWCAFAAVDRSPDDPRRPLGYRDLEPFWRKRGYVRQDGLRFPLEWREIGEEEASIKTLTVWTRPL